MRDADAPEYITAEEAAAILDLSPRQVNRYGKGDPPRLRTRRVGRRILYARADVEALAATLRGQGSGVRGQGSGVRGQGSGEAEPLPEGVDPLTVGELISLQEAAEYAGLSRGSLHQYAQRGRLAAKKIGNMWVTTRAAIDLYLQSRDPTTIPRKYRNKT